MLKKLMIASASLLMFACNNESETPEAKSDSPQHANTVNMNAALSEDEKKEGWQLLFDGNSLAGWHEYGNTPSSGLWKIQDGALFFDGTQKRKEHINTNHNLVTDGDYANFHLKLEWKVDTGSNSGIMFYVKEDTAQYKHPFETGPEMQVVDNDRHKDAKNIKHRAGDLYDLIACSTETAKPALEWNLAEIKSKDGQLDLYLNGTLVVSTKLWDDNWKKMVAASKFKNMPGFGIYTTGKICLQDHGDNVWYRNIKIRPL